MLSQYRHILQRLSHQELPSQEELSAFIEACAPEAFSGPVPDVSESLKKTYLQEAGLPCPSECAISVERLAEPDRQILLQELFTAAQKTAIVHFGRKIYIRGLIEISNFCRQDCRYCGIRASNSQAERYRLTPEDIFSCCAHGYELGFRTFVLQGGEDGWFTDERLISILHHLKQNWPDCAVTLSVGERNFSSYMKLREAGADRFLLRHEAADPLLYSLLHPVRQSWETRMRCLRDLKSCQFQTGAGFMVGTPWQTSAHLASDLSYLFSLQPEMVGIGPFIPHDQTPFAPFPAGSVERTLVLLAMTRLLLPKAMLPSTTALGTAAGDGRERGILAGANVLMPNLSPKEARSRYRLYNNKLSEGAECADNLLELKKRMNTIGYQIVIDRGDFSAE